MQQPREKKKKIASEQNIESVRGDTHMPFSMDQVKNDPN